MIKALLARKLLAFVLYSAVVTALPVCSQLAPPADRAACACQAPDCTACQAARSPVVDSQSSRLLPEDAGCSVAERSGGPDSWWRRGPLRRAVRAVACFVSRPWR